MLDGSKMVGDEKNFSVLAGISALELVMSTPDSKFSQTAADVLADYIRTNIDNETRDTVGQRARIALEKGAEIGLTVDRKLNVDHRSKEFDQTIKPYNGFKSVSYFGGEISETEFEKIRKPDQTSFNATTLKSFTQFDITDRFTDCTFMFCSLKSVVMDDQESHRFSRCDFSSTHITLTNPIPREELVNMKEKFTQCTYRSDSPPTGDVLDDFLVYMEPIPSPP
jgi:hypothetical protein